VLDGHLVAEALAHLGDAERDLHARALLHVHELHEHRLRGLGPQVHRAGGQRRLDPPAQLAFSVVLALGQRLADQTDDVADRIHRPEAGAEHQVELALLAQKRRAAVRAHVAAAPRLGALEHRLPSRCSATPPGQLLGSFSCAALARPCRRA
jgi:hypothetical protein